MHDEPIARVGVRDLVLQQAGSKLAARRELVLGGAALDAADCVVVERARAADLSLRKKIDGRLQGAVAPPLDLLPALRIETAPPPARRGIRKDLVVEVTEAGRKVIISPGFRCGDGEQSFGHRFGQWCVHLTRWIAGCDHRIDRHGLHHRARACIGRRYHDRRIHVGAWELHPPHARQPRVTIAWEPSSTELAGPGGALSAPERERTIATSPNVHSLRMGGRYPTTSSEIVSPLDGPCRALMLAEESARLLEVHERDLSVPVSSSRTRRTAASSSSPFPSSAFDRQRSSLRRARRTACPSRGHRRWDRLPRFLNHAGCLGLPPADATTNR